MMRELFVYRKKEMICYGVLTILLAGLMIGNSFVLNWLTDIATQSAEMNYSIVILIILLFILGQSFVYYFQQLSADKYAKILKTDLKNQYINEYLSSEYLKISQNKSSYYLAQLTTNLDLIEENYFKVLFWGGYLFTQFVFALIAACFINPILAFFCVLLSIPSILVPILSKHHIEVSSTNVVKANEVNTMVLNDLLQGTRTFKFFLSEEKIQQQLLDENNRLLNKQIQNEKVQNRVGVVNKTFSDILYFGSWVVGIYFILKSDMTLGKMVGFTQLITNISFPLHSVIGLIGQWIGGNAAYLEFSSFFRLNERIEKNILIKDKLQSIQYEALQYEIEEKIILKDINLTLQTDKKYLIKGESGAGKSSLFYPLFKLSDDYTGKLMLNGVDIKQINEKSVYKKIGYFTQKDRIFHASIRQNLTLFQEEISDKLLVDVLNRVHLKLWFENKSLDTIISEEELSLSAGERQRFLLARLLLKDYDFLILDELTSGLNEEMAIFIEELMIGLPVGWLMVSHIGIDRLEQKVETVFEVSQGTIHKL